MKMSDAKTFLRVALLLAFAVSGGNILARAQTLTTIWSFTGSNGDGPFPNGHLPFDNNHRTTADGGGTVPHWKAFLFGPDCSVKYASWVPPGAFRKGGPSRFPRAMTGKIETRINSPDTRLPSNFVKWMSPFCWAQDDAG